MYEAIVVCFVVCLVFFTCMFFMDLCGLIQINDDDDDDDNVAAMPVTPVLNLSNYACQYMTDMWTALLDIVCNSYVLK